MAVGAAQGAALQKHYIPQSGAVHRPPGTARNGPLHAYRGDVERPGDDLSLLFPGELVKVHRIAGNPDGQAGVLLGGAHRRR